MTYVQAQEGADVIDIDEVYDRQFFSRRKAGGFVPRANALETLAELTCATFDPDEVFDVGCGDGCLLAGVPKSVRVGGIEGAVAAREFIPASLRSKVYNLDIRDLPEDWGREFGLWDAVVCLEVAEHIEEQHSERLVRGLTSMAKDRILFSAAEPGQGGTGHVNEQPFLFWVDLFAVRGWELESDLPEAWDRFRSEWEGINVIRNFRVLKRAEPLDD